jgi:hypothetical protein
MVPFQNGLLTLKHYSVLERVKKGEEAAYDLWPNNRLFWP